MSSGKLDWYHINQSIKTGSQFQFFYLEMALVRKYNLKWNHVFLVLSVFGVCSNHSVSIFFCWDDHYIEDSVETQKKSPKKQQDSHFFFKFNQIVVKVINERFCFSSFTKTLQAEVRYFKLGPQNLPQDGSFLTQALNFLLLTNRFSNSINLL